MIVTRFAFPHRSPYPLIVPWTWVTPARTAASVFATPQPASSWQWIPTVTPVPSNAATTAPIAAPSASGSVPPFVSQQTSVAAPALAAARRHASAYSASSAKASKKCSAS